MHLGISIFTRFFGKKIGQDEFGNKYYASKKKCKQNIGRIGSLERRWVIYNGMVEPSKVPPYWHAWLHHMREDPPTKQDLAKKHRWEKTHKPNLTGTKYAYLAPGSKKSTQATPKTSGDYEAWTP